LVLCRGANIYHKLNSWQLIKKLSATPVLPTLNDQACDGGQQDPEKALQANKATFFFRVVGVTPLTWSMD
jgi:hypothetical protein